ncbi:uncharacterized protein LOC129581162 [Paramacrobiotus metropolitanus]|uniref:uncharacterized protein LOC129581162 n=1 Tax=Paramacrobiotus metropolitanus TaxID=2943436 RepID=UPI00244585A3|nr:uncharacterized protein LOC129581162 [Paramacrobiotus metropolitanus]
MENPTNEKPKVYQTLKCPNCQLSYSYCKGLAGSQFPLILKCGHSVCFHCIVQKITQVTDLFYDQLFDNILNTNGTERNGAAVGHSRCAVCPAKVLDKLTITELKRHGRKSFQAEDVLRIFPLDLFTLGWLGVEDNFPRDLLPQWGNVEAYDMIKEPTDQPNDGYAITTGKAGKQYKMSILCGRCENREPAACLYCETTATYLCVHCQNDSLDAKEAHEHLYLSHDGQVLNERVMCGTHGKPEMLANVQSGEAFCLDCSGNKLEDVRMLNWKALSRVQPATKLAKSVDKATKDCGRATGMLMEELLKNGQSKCDVYISFMQKLATSFQNLCHKHLTKLNDMDGRRLGFLCQMESPMEQQIRRLEYLSKKVEFVMREGKSVRNTDLDEEMESIVEEIVQFELFNEDCIRDGRIAWEKCEVKLNEEMSPVLRRVLDELTKNTDFSRDTLEKLQMEAVADLLEFGEIQDAH